MDKFLILFCIIRQKCANRLFEFSIAVDFCPLALLLIIQKIFSIWREQLGRKSNAMENLGKYIVDRNIYRLDFLQQSTDAKGQNCVYIVWKLKTKVWFFFSIQTLGRTEGWRGQNICTYLDGMHAFSNINQEKRKNITTSGAWWWFHEILILWWNERVGKKFLSDTMSL